MEPNEQKPQDKKHRATCASRLVWADGKSCNMPCDCESPSPWVIVPDRETE